MMGRGFKNYIYNLYTSYSHFCLYEGSPGSDMKAYIIKNMFNYNKLEIYTCYIKKFRH